MGLHCASCDRRKEVPRQILCRFELTVHLGCVYGSSWVTKFIGSRRKLWTKAIQRRVGTTSSMLGSMKSVKMTGLSNVIFNIIQGQRVHELEVSKKYRVMALWRLVLCKLSLNAISSHN